MTRTSCRPRGRADSRAVEGPGRDNCPGQGQALDRKGMAKQQVWIVAPAGRIIVGLDHADHVYPGNRARIPAGQATPRATLPACPASVPT